MILKNNKRIDGCSDTVPVGTLNPFLGTKAPYGYLICQGQKVSKTTYKELYEICGDTFGQSTDTEFYLPDLRGQTIAGYKEGDSTFGTLGGLIGSLTHLHSTGNHTLTIDEIPNHSHNADNYCIGAPAGSSREGEYYTLLKPYGSSVIYPLENAVANKGGDQPHNHGDTSSNSSLQPTIVLNWIVKAFQLMPNQSYVSSVKQNSDINTYSCDYINDNIDNSYVDIFEGDFNSLIATSANKVMNYCIKTDSLNNKPAPYWGWLTSYFMSNETMKQIFISDINTMYIRQKLNGNWMPWRCIGEDIYSTEEQVIGTWKDGKPLYRKVIDFGSLPNNGTKTVMHNISNLEEVTDIKGTALSTLYGTRIPLNFVGYNQQIQIGTYAIQIDNKADASSFYAYVTIEYTKTTD